MFKRKTNVHTTNYVRPRVHDPARDFRSVTPDNKLLFLNAMENLRKAGYNGDGYAFGSRTHGTFTDQSDIDVMLPIPLCEIVNLREVVGTVHGLRIDLQMGRPKMPEVWRIRDTLSK